MGSRSKRYIEIYEKIDNDKIYTLDEGIELIKDSSNLKFDETVEIAVKKENAHGGIVITASHNPCEWLGKKKDVKWNFQMNYGGILKTSLLIGKEVINKNYNKVL